jgi:DNA-binding MurR/RpiR family transcriptional regulator
LHKANRILFFGLGSSFCACEDAALKYKRLQKFAVAFNNTHDAAVTLPCLTENDVVIGVSHSGETKETCKVLALAKKRKVPTIAVTTFPSASINAFADYTLFTVTKENPNHRVAFTSRISQLFLLDSLFLATLYKEKENNLEKIEQALVSISLTNV